MDNFFVSFCSRSANVSALLAASVLILSAFILLLFRKDIIRSDDIKSSKKPSEQPGYSEILKKNEIASNMFLAKALLAVTGILLIVSVGVSTDMFAVADKTVFGLVLACLMLASASSALYTIKIEGRSDNAKRFLISSFIMGCFIICILLPREYCTLLIFPVLISIRYGDGKFTAKAAAACATANILSRPAGLVFGLYNGYYELGNVKTFPGTTIVFTDSLTESLINGGVITSRYIINRELSSAFFTTLIFIFTGCFAAAIAQYGKKMLTEGFVLSREKDQAEREASEVRARIMMSQLQPHFLYNSLSAIMAIDGNPPETVDAIADFSKYLRANLNSLTSSELIPFSAELDHIDHYLSLEKLRFSDKIKVVTDIETTDVLIPPLAVQMAVENAVKHGITKKTDGGTVKISTRKDGRETVITVEDNGVGFDTAQNFSQAEGHIGIASGMERIKRLTGGSMTITSKIGEGTKVVFRIPKEGQR